MNSKRKKRSPWVLVAIATIASLGIALFFSLRSPSPGTPCVAPVDCRPLIGLRIIPRKEETCFLPAAGAPYCSNTCTSNGDCSADWECKGTMGSNVWKADVHTMSGSAMFCVPR